MATGRSSPSIERTTSATVGPRRPTGADGSDNTGRMTTISADDIRLATPEFWAQPEEEREAAFATLRRDKPISFHEELAYTEGVPPGPGFWAVPPFEDVWAASPPPDVFQSGQGGNIGDLPIEIHEFFGSMIAMDAP